MAAVRSLGWGRGKIPCDVIGRGLETWERTALGPQSVALVGNSVGRRRRHVRRRAVGRVWPQIVRYLVGRTALRTASGTLSVGAAGVNGVGMPVTVWGYWRQDVV